MFLQGKHCMELLPWHWTFFVYVHLRCIANKLKKISKMSTLPSPGKISADAHVDVWLQ